MKTQLTIKLAMSTALVALLSMLVLGRVSSMVWALNPAYSVWLTAVVCIVAAPILGRITRVENWARMIGPDTTVRTAAKYLTLTAAFAFAANGIAILIVKVAQPALLQGSKLYFFKFTLDAYMMRSLIGSPIAEELFYRGWLLAWLDRWELPPIRLLGTRISMASALSSLAFVIPHAFNAQAISWLRGVSLVLTFLVGVFFASIRQKSGGLLIPMLCHSLCNFISHAFFVLV